MGGYVRKPEWLKIRLGNDDKFSETNKIIGSRKVNTICVSGRCPNHAECWTRGTASFMILGDICTRSCKFCNTKTGNPYPPDPGEPERLAETIKLMKLRHVVITSVDRDDLDDFGCLHWVNVIRTIKETIPGITMEVLIPDFQGSKEYIDKIADAEPDVISHNIETVKRLTPEVRSAAKYNRSLFVLDCISKSGLRTKSGIMLGLGESETEVLETFDDLLHAGCEVLTIGQYLQPSSKHYPVKEYIRPEKFEEYKIEALNRGFKIVESGPLVRSSYFAERHI